jgi:anti-sigma B factor antagonist
MALTESPSVIFPRRSPAASAGPNADRTVRLRGEYDISTVAALSETLARAIALDDADLLVDLSGVQFMDAATIGVIMRARSGLRLRSRSLTLRSPSPCARRILDLCGLTYLLDPGVDREPSPPGADADLLAARQATSVARRRGP